MSLRTKIKTGLIGLVLLLSSLSSTYASHVPGEEGEYTPAICAIPEILLDNLKALSLLTPDQKAESGMLFESLFVRGA